MKNEFTAKTLDEAKAMAAAEFGVAAEEIDFDILEPVSYTHLLSGTAHRRQGRYSRKGNTPHRKDRLRYHHQKTGNSSASDRYQGDRQHDPDRKRSA